MVFQLLCRLINIDTSLASLEISDGTFPEIYSNLPGISGHLLITYVNQVFLSSTLQSNCPDLYV